MVARKSTAAPTRKRASRRVNVRDLEAAYHKLKRARAIFSSDDVQRIESRLTGAPDGRCRRMALTSLTLNGERLFSMGTASREDAEIIASIAAAAKYAARGLRELAEILDVAQTRAKFALVDREDMREVLAAGERALFEPDGARAH